MKSFYNRRVLITGGLGFIGSNLERRLVEFGADVLLIDSLVPEYGGNLFNIAGIENKVRVNISDVRDEHSMKYLVQGVDYLFNLAGQTSHMDSMQDPITDMEINAKSQLFILEAQVKYYKPDIVINQAMSEIGSNFLKEIKPYTRIVIGQIASPLPENEDFSSYRLIISSLPNIVAYFRRRGISSELNRFAFDPEVLSVLEKKERKASLSFVGSLSRHHENRINLLEHLCKHFDIEIWGQGIDSLAERSLIRQCYKGKAWGIEMYRILYNSKITLNHHIGIAESYANNMRLFEATGTSAMLITDWKENLHEMFEPGKDVVAYRSPEECVNLVKYYLEHDEEREAIARAGQERTLKEHNYYRRMQELGDIVHKYL